MRHPKCLVALVLGWPMYACVHVMFFANSYEDAMSVYLDMPNEGCSPSPSTFKSLLGHFHRGRQWEVMISLCRGESFSVPVVLEGSKLACVHTSVLSVIVDMTALGIMPERRMIEGLVDACMHTDDAVTMCVRMLVVVACCCLHRVPVSCG